MSIWNKLLLGFIFVAAMAFWYLGMRTLRAHSYWRTWAKKLEAQRDAVKKENQDLLSGVVEDDKVVKDGIEQLQARLDKILLDRGRVWWDWQPKQVSVENKVRVARTNPKTEPHGILLHTVLYVFEYVENRGDQDNPIVGKGGEYLGEFEVAEIGEQETLKDQERKEDFLVLQPTFKLSEREQKRLQESKGPWVLHERMPVDHHYVFAELNEDELKTLLPEDRLPEFLHEGKELTWEQVEELKLSGEIVAEDGRPLRDEQGEKIPGAKGKYQRPLYDYRELLAAFYRDRLILRDMIVSLEKDVGLLKDSAAEAKAILSAREEEIRKLAEQQATVRKERGAVWSHYQAVRQRVVALEQELNRLLEENRRLAAQLVQAQLQAAQQINARTSAMARSPEGGN